MTIIRVRLCERDRKEYGVDGELLPEELTVDTEAFKDLTAGDHDRIDTAIDAPLIAYVRVINAVQLATAPARVQWIAAWLAVWKATGEMRPINDFQPHLMQATFSREVVDNPPAGTSESSSEAEAAGTTSPQ